MVYMNESDSYQLFAHFLQKYREGKNYFTGVSTIRIDMIEVLVSYQVFTEEPIYYELEYMVTENDVEVFRELDTKKFAARFGQLMFYFFFEKLYHEQYEFAYSEKPETKEVETDTEAAIVMELSGGNEH